MVLHNSVSAQTDSSAWNQSQFASESFRFIPNATSHPFAAAAAAALPFWHSTVFCRFENFVSARRQIIMRMALIKHRDHPTKLKPNAETKSFDENKIKSKDSARRRSSRCEFFLFCCAVSSTFRFRCCSELIWRVFLSRIRIQRTKLFSHFVPFVAAESSHVVAVFAVTVIYFTSCCLSSFRVYIQFPRAHTHTLSLPRSLGDGLQLGCRPKWRSIRDREKPRTHTHRSAREYSRFLFAQLFFSDWKKLNFICRAHSHRRRGVKAVPFDSHLSIRISIRVCCAQRCLIEHWIYFAIALHHCVLPSIFRIVLRLH